MLHVKPHFLTLMYTQAMMISLLFNDNPESILMIGLGGGSLAKFLLHHYPNCTIDVIEYREKVARIAHGYFMVPETPKLNIVIGDATSRIKDIENNKYDLILLDAFDESNVSPSITRHDFLANCKDKLNKEGILATNLWSKAEDYKHTLQVINNVFAGNVLQYLVKKKSNAIIFSSKKDLNISYLNKLHSKAQEMQTHLDIKMSEFLTRLIHQNSFLFKLLH